MKGLKCQEIHGGADGPVGESLSEKSYPLAKSENSNLNRKKKSHFMKNVLINLVYCL